MYWKRATRVPQVADTMSLNRWEAIKKMIHFSNNENQQQGKDDPLCKIRPLVSHLTTKFSEIPMAEKLVVDEQMIPFKGKSRLKVYLPSKPKKNGVQDFSFGRIRWCPP